MSNQIKVTLTLVMAIVIAFLGYRFMKDLPFFHESKVIYTNFEKVNGLTSGSPIYINGVKVGSVDNIQLKGQDNVRVALNFNNDININKGSVAYLESNGLLGNKVISIQKGSSSKMVPNGGTIRGEYSSGMLGSLQQSGHKLAQDASQSFDKLNHALGQVQQMLNHKNRLKIDQMLTNLQQSTEQLSLLMKQKRKKMEKSIDHANQFLGNLDTVTTQNKTRIDSAMAGLNHSMQNLKEISEKLDKTNAKLNSILTKINNGKGSMGKLVNDPSLYNNIDSLSVRLNRLVGNINKHPTRYLKGLKLINLF